MNEPENQNDQARVAAAFAKKDEERRAFLDNYNSKMKRDKRGGTASARPAKYKPRWKP